MRESVRSATHALLARAGAHHVFGNPGSNELPFLHGLPEELRYVLALHEGAAVGMADGWAQASGRLGVVNLHAASGTGNAMGALTNAATARTPLLLLAGQQVRATVGQEVLLANADATTLTRPLTGFAAEPLAAADVPRTVAEAIHATTVGRRGPAFVSVPFDDWDEDAPEDVDLLLGRTVREGRRAAPGLVDELAARLLGARSPLLVCGADLDGRVTPEALIALAERLDAPVHVAPSPHRLPFPNRHRRFAGVLPASVRGIAHAVAGHDLVLVLGAPVFRYHQHEPGRALPAGTALVQVTDDAAAAGRAPVGDAVLADPAHVVDGLVDRLGVDPAAPVPADHWRPCADPPAGTDGVHPAAVFATLRRTLAPETAYVVESTSTNADWWAQMDLRHPGSYFFPAAGGLGFGLPAAVGVALAQPHRPVVAVVGEGSANYGITALWTAAQLRLPVTCVILRNGGYGALRWFAERMGTPGVPGLELDGLDLVPVAEGYGVPGTRVTEPAMLATLLRRVPDGPRLLQVDTSATAPDGAPVRPATSTKKGERR